MFFSKGPDFTENDIESVIKACLAHNSKAQKLLIKLFYGFAKAISLRYSANSYEADEIINDGFLKVFNNLHKYDHSKPFKSWLKIVIVNTAIDYFRKNEKHRSQIDINDVEVIDSSEDIVSRISAEEILAIVQRLSPAYRMVFTLYVIDGYNHREIADLLGIQEGTSKSNLRDARRKLQSMIKNAYPDLYLIYTLKNIKLNEN